MKRSNNEPDARCWGMNPTHTPSSAPTKEPSSHPSNNPSSNPTSEPSKNPSAIPTLCPTSNPSKAPSKEPSSHPSNNPSSNPTSEPSNNPSNLTYGNGLQAIDSSEFYVAHWPNPLTHISISWGSSIKIHWTKWLYTLKRRIKYVARHALRRRNRRFCKRVHLWFLSKITIIPIILLSKIIKFHEKKATMIQIINQQLKLRFFILA